MAEDRNGAVTFPMMVSRKDCLLSTLLVVVLTGIYAGVILYDMEPAGRLIMIPVLGLALIAVLGTYGLWGISSITVSQSGVMLSIGPVVLKKYSAGDIRTVAKSYVRGRNAFFRLIILTKQASGIEALGEEALRRKRFLSQELKFREKEPDWENVCLGTGLQKMGIGLHFRYIWMEFTPERQRLLREMFPNAAHLEAKHYSDPPGI